MPVACLFLIVESFWELKGSGHIGCLPVQTDAFLGHWIDWRVDIWDINVLEILGVFSTDLVAVRESPYAFASWFVVFELSFKLISARQGPGSMEQLALEPFSRELGFRLKIVP